MRSARDVAFEVLMRVESGGYASDLLRRESEGLEKRDAGLAETIVLGSLRTRMQLDFLIEHFAGRPQLKLDPEVRIALRMGIYQLRYLDRIPAHAAVAESVELVKRARKRSAAGFVNAVLRKVNRAMMAPRYLARSSHGAQHSGMDARPLGRAVWRGNRGRNRARRARGAAGSREPGHGPPAGYRRRNRSCLCSRSSRG